MHPGTAFGTVFLTESKNVIGMDEIVTIAQPLELSRIVVSATWLDVLDRRKPTGAWNLLIDTGSSTEQLKVIDFGLGLTEILGGVAVLGDADINVRCPAEWRFYLNRADTQEALTEVLGINDEAIDAVIARIPDAWRHDAPRLSEMAEYLKRRRDSLASVLQAGGLL